MNDEQFEDLKQFIDARIAQTEAMLEVRVTATETKLDRLETQVATLRQEMHDGFAGIGDSLDAMQAEHDKAIVGLDQRLTQLEQQTAA